MKRYSPNQHVPMKFHNLYVWLLNPLGILVLGGLAVIALCALLGVPALPALQDRLDGDGSEAARLMLWFLFGFFTLAFLFALISEVLLAKRRTVGVLILILGYVLNVVSAAMSAYNDRSPENLIGFGITLLVGLLVCIYYWKRRRLFH
ncbi:MAG: hypothetical protein VB104_06755 [Candidatus Limiplasma sp.]|nr:hypothetical protein [Candidatus Limiplasma sp.]